MIIEGLYTTNVYFCSIDQILKGDFVPIDEEGRILIVLFKDCVEIGQNYIIMLNQVSDNSTLYTQSSRKSIIPSDDLAAISEVEEALRQEDNT